MTAIKDAVGADGRPFRRVWIKAFWGFDPENEGFLGFTREGDRKRLFDQYRAGDLILIYGTKGGRTEREDRGKALGFLEVVPDAIDWRTRISEEALNWKRKQGALEKWNFAMPVRRAWRVTPGQALLDIEKLAPQTYERSNVQNIATRGKLLTDAEARAALRLEVAETAVFASPDAPDVEKPLAEDGYRPSRGLVGAPGERTVVVEDGPCKIYLMRWQGEAAHLLGTRFGDVRMLTVLKVGMSSDPARRCLGLNSSLPPAGVARWTVVAESNFYPNIDAAKKREDRLKSLFDQHFKSLGGEYFLAPLQEAGKRFLALAETG
ncbi:MAG: hypothetical protein ISS15_21110 [Alphaproteobacteria bacterium]|nr:hypothetical protein [Reyranella sp.]MBL6940079.1 hypothetical protein [Alphaproteobacteria bacterium]MBL7100166.1 hypothetical protein [Alphaproteobacteria bacterium]